ncbi:hypothetical protein K04M1_52320 (plasmid) [Vibrio alginolyticus]|nr:hypothetical protein K04M1_52320 [Vibrio alginolyticus]
MIGDKMLGEATHGLHSSSESMYLIVELIQGPLKGAKVVYKPTLSYDTFVYQSSEIQFNGNRAAFPSIIITPDENQTVGYVPVLTTTLLQSWNGVCLWYD